MPSNFVVDLTVAAAGLLINAYVTSRVVAAVMNAKFEEVHRRIDRAERQVNRVEDRVNGLLDRS